MKRLEETQDVIQILESTSHRERGFGGIGSPNDNRITDFDVLLMEMAAFY
jgi:hypothetical protein